MRFRMRRAVAICLVAAAVSGGAALSATRSQGSDPTGSDPVGSDPDYGRDVRPILERHCYECHGPTKSKGSLRLDVRDRAFKGGVTGPAVVAGDSDQSLLLRRLLGLDGEDRMPLDKDALPDAEIALLRRWIDHGAAWPADAGAAPAQTAVEPETHWAYVRPKRPPVPNIKHDAWARTPIDHFIAARLEAEALEPSPEASRETLLRRVTLDLVGLPPTIEELDAFLADTAPDAYERVVDRLLASPHYGERWARPWLDLARYADSHGYEKDALRTMWRYRDWVIDALNRDEPFDQFTIEQIAGDMLPGATDEQRVATGFHRNTLLNQEGGIDVEEARWETLVDRVNTTGTVWLGSTIGCAQCHNHKYDPFSQRDYYRMLAFFDNAEYSVVGEQGGDHYIQEPSLDLPTPEQAAKRDQLKTRLDALRTSLDASSPLTERQQAVWERAMLGAEAAWTPLPPRSAHAAKSTRLDIQADHSVLASGDAPGDETYTITAPLPASGITALRLEALPDDSLPKGGPGRDYYGNFALTGITASIDGGPPLTFASAHDDGHVGGNEAAQLLEAPDKTGRSRDLPPGWSIDATRDDTRLRRQAVFVLATPLQPRPVRTITVALSFAGGTVPQALGRFRLSTTASAAPTRIVAISPAVRRMIATAPLKRDAKERERLGREFRAKSPVFARKREAIASLEKQIGALGIVTAQVMRDRPGFDRPSTYVRERGSFLSKGEKVYAATPSVLPPLPDNAMPNRLGLARWLVSPVNPLTARVAVNRAWEQFLGRGLVETSEDFGTQGSPPSHPELLDWLATELVRQKWSVKAIHRLIVTSAAYRQSAAASPVLLERDPYNRLLGRGPRFRLDAETLRDTVLAASGLLSLKIGGPSVFPLQPEGIWDNPYSDAKWVTSPGEDRHRRGMYTFIRRTSPYPSLLAFDGTSREFCTVRRVRTNTPLQALVTLNDEAYFEAARALASRMLDAPVDGGDDAAVSARAAYGFRRCTSRQPTPEETRRIVASYEKQLAAMQASPAAAARINAATDGGPNAPERAAWTLVANALLNLDETFTK